LAGVQRAKIQSQLREVGFDDERQLDLVGGLSGGWKMKLELARAMLYNADLLLLDEVCRSFDLSPLYYLTAHSQLITQVIFVVSRFCLISETLQLDRDAVKWLEQYLITHRNITCLIVSHDSR
jgi:elongation factor 3